MEPLLPNVAPRHAFDNTPNMSFSTLFVRGVPGAWTAADLYKCFSVYGAVVGAFVYQEVDVLGKQYGLVQMGSYRLASEMCEKVRFIRAEDSVLSVMPTDIVNLAEWLVGGPDNPVTPQGQQPAVVEQQPFEALAVPLVAPLVGPSAGPPKSLATDLGSYERTFPRRPPGLGTEVEYGFITQELTDYRP